MVNYLKVLAQKVWHWHLDFTNGYHSTLTKKRWKHNKDQLQEVKFKTPLYCVLKPNAKVWVLWDLYCLICDSGKRQFMLPSAPKDELFVFVASPGLVWFYLRKLFSPLEIKSCLITKGLFLRNCSTSTTCIYMHSNSAFFGESIVNST